MFVWKIIKYRNHGFGGVGTRIVNNSDPEGQIVVTDNFLINNTPSITDTRYVI